MTCKGTKLQISIYRTCQNLLHYFRATELKLWIKQGLIKFLENIFWKIVFQKTVESG